MGFGGPWRHNQYPFQFSIDFFLHYVAPYAVCFVCAINYSVQKNLILIFVMLPNWIVLNHPTPIVEKNPNKFKIDKKELISRRCFIDATRDEVKSMKEKMSLNRNRDRDITARQPLLDTVNNESNNNQTLNNNSSGLASTLGTMASRHSGTKYSKLENAIDSPGHYSTLDSPSHRFIGESVSVQQRMLQGQDEQLDVISDSIGTLKTVSRQIGIELDEQAV